MEYVLDDAQEPHLFIIRKQYRRTPAAADETPHAFYYILDGSIYQVRVSVMPSAGLPVLLIGPRSVMPTA